MTGPEHYAHAQELLEMAGDDEVGSEIERYHLRKAQAHATLALAAATAEASVPSVHFEPWREVIR